MKARRYIRARFKALAAGIGGYVLLGLAYVLLDDNARATVLGLVPDWARSIALILTPVGLAWAVERTRNRGGEAPAAEEA